MSNKVSKFNKMSTTKVYLKRTDDEKKKNLFSCPATSSTFRDRSFFELNIKNASKHIDVYSMNEVNAKPESG